MVLGWPVRPRISFSNGKFYHDNCHCRVVMRKDIVGVGCTDVTPAALRELVRLYDEHFGGAPDEVVVQP